jgi:hypothetical protein
MAPVQSVRQRAYDPDLDAYMLSFEAPKLHDMQQE